MARRRGGAHLDQLHVGHYRPAEGRAVHASWRVPECDGRVRRGGAVARVGVPVDAADVPLQRLVLPVGGDGGRSDARDDAQGRPRRGVAPDRGRGSDALLRRPDRATVSGRASRGAPRGAAGDGAGRRGAALADAVRTHGRAQLPRDPRLRPDRDVRADHRRDLAPRLERRGPGGAGAAARPAGPGLSDRRPGARGRRRRQRRAPRRRDDGRGGDARQQRDARLLRRRRRHRPGVPRRLVPLRRPGGVASRRQHRAARPREGHHHLGRREHLDDRDRADRRVTPGGDGVRGDRHPARQVGRAPEGLRDAA